MSVPLVRQLILEDMKRASEAHFEREPGEVFVFGTDPEDGGGIAHIDQYTKNRNWYLEYLQAEGVEFGPYVLHGFKEIDQPMEEWNPSKWDKNDATNIVFGFNNWLLREYDKWIDSLPPAERLTVVSQEPAGGTPINRGDKINLWVSKGQVTMPNLEGLTKPEAEQAVVAYGLIISDVKYAYTSDPALVDRVIFQRPEAYESVSPNYGVEIEIGLPDETLLKAFIPLDLSKLEAGQTVTIWIVNEKGEQERWWSRTFEELVEEVPPVPVYSDVARSMPYVVFFDEVAQYNDKVVFKP